MRCHCPLFTSSERGGFAGKKGTKIIGICNGFQILTESGLLPGALIKNLSQKFVCKTVKLKVENTNTKFTHLCKDGDVISVPIAHGEGNYFCDQDTLNHLKDNNQVVFRYCSDEGTVAQENNPNGSIENIAGIVNKDGNILGMMPHPERRCEELLGNDDGLKILTSMIQNFAEN